MTIEEFDKNLALQTVKETDVEWHCIDEDEFSTFGLQFSEEENIFVRMPQSVSKDVSAGVHHLSRMNTGGRIRFATDSPYIAVRCEQIPFWPTNTMCTATTHGFALYANDVYRGMYAPDQKYIYQAIEEKNSSFMFDGIRRNLGENKKECALFFPLFGGVRKLYIGIRKGSRLWQAKPYLQTKKVVFYGSSITHGAAASHAGNDYAAMLSRKLDFDYVNLGFSGNAKGEPVMAEYLASLNADILVMEYDYNALCAKELAEKHLPFYQAFRARSPKTSVIFLSKPDFEYDEESAKRRDTVKATYKWALERGDDVYFIDGQRLFGRVWRDCCTQDTCHPNDLGFYRMAKSIEPILKKLFKKDKK